MCLMNKPDAYGLISKMIHWITALLILGMLTMGYKMGTIPFGPDKLWVIALHKSVGLLILCLVFIRIAWHILSRKPKSLDTHAPWEKFLAHATHIFLYVAMFVMPLSGWVMTSAGDFSISFFGIPVPDIVQKNETLFKNAKEVHETLALIIVFVIGLHMAGAFKHHFIDRDRTIKRMTTERLGFGGGAVLVLIAGLLMLPPLYFVASDLLGDDEESAQAAPAATDVSASAPIVPESPIAPPEKGAWVIDHPKSKIQFEATQYGQSFTGNFEKFDGRIVFDPAKLETSKAVIKIQISSMKTGSDDRDQQALGADWFDVPKNPEAIFETNSIKAIDAKNYEAKGTLMIRDVTLPITLPFSLVIQENTDGTKRAVMTSELSLNRLDFGIGQGEWKSTGAIGDAVKIKIELEATQ